MSVQFKQIPRLAITLGEPAGIGAEQIVQLAQTPWDIEWVVIGNAALIQQRATDLNLPIQIQYYQTDALPSANLLGQVKVIDIDLPQPVIAGQLNVANAGFVIQLLDRAIAGCMSGEFDGMVTGAVHKGIINEAGLKFTGHTEYLAEKSRTDQVVMMLATPGLRVPLATTHLPLRAIPDAITPELLEKVITITYDSLQQQFGIANPVIYIAGLNPHAGEDGHLGREEIDVMIPVIQKLKQRMPNLIGPLPADTMFTQDKLKKGDAFLAMYHDQGLPVLKHLGFGQAVNVTLGLPFIRTSVDHGTALDIAGKGICTDTSFRYAIQVACDMLTGKTQETPHV
ncbi:4-hydroxythreonine-4-phosphate dehydrogenase PdxA [Thiosulfativibrio zosterae]|uniref:4-hydroxythreonine-4-phosphate dehydrogenase n=1 Tax=Thiosulfativibrio zosterae TaxID=2675053 RepID=A0A6F8PLM9_9GAMM|nr:4-hydroxythreonine-4-phosphate dehydrogenase PdxA [Thiosulfativibrio zosterae]BBP43009.1 4-hydroxythreonine-4-phosphate dehydrogenase [Thiosulfativibrio zosterae]